jgi:hypothetical protein
MMIRLTLAVLLLALTAACSGPGDTDDETPEATTGTDGQVAAPSATEQTGVVIIPTVTPQGQPTDPASQTPTDPNQQVTQPPASDPSQTPTGQPPVTTEPSPTMGQPPAGALLPNNRIISYYGHPNSTQMGILGEGTKDDALALLREQGAAYAAADPSKPVVLAFELIATVAQAHPGDDGLYIAYTGDEIIQEYVDYVTANDLILILDIQIGLDTLANQINIVRKWLEYPNVHLAIDPEFSMRANEIVPTDRIPGEFIGELNGLELNEGLLMVDQIVREKGIPPKIVIVHQFESDMLFNKDQIVVPPGVDFVLDMDGFGASEAKVANYGHFVRDELVEYGGIKLFYQQDVPVMTPAEIVALDPTPLVVIYQ